jgi:hypothetical protein
MFNNQQFFSSGKIFPVYVSTNIDYQKYISIAVPKLFIKTNPRKIHSPHLR